MKVLTTEFKLKVEGASLDLIAKVEAVKEVSTQEFVAKVENGKTIIAFGVSIPVNAVKALVQVLGLLGLLGLKGESIPVGGDLTVEEGE